MDHLECVRNGQTLVFKTRVKPSQRDKTFDQKKYHESWFIISNVTGEVWLHPVNVPEGKLYSLWATCISYVFQLCLDIKIPYFEKQLFCSTSYLWVFTLAGLMYIAHVNNIIFITTNNQTSIYYWSCKFQNDFNHLHEHIHCLWVFIKLFSGKPLIFLIPNCMHVVYPRHIALSSHLNSSWKQKNKTKQTNMMIPQSFKNPPYAMCLQYLPTQ